MDALFNGQNAMRAVVCHGPKDYRIESVPIPAITDNEILLKIDECGICTSDCKCWSGAKMYWGGNGNPPYVIPPVTIGHEFFGTVAALGAGAKEHFNVDVGDVVIAEQILPCWKCTYCRGGTYWMCERNYLFGFQNTVTEGGMAEYMKIPAGALVHRIPKGPASENAVLIEPLSCAIHCVNRGDIQLSDTVVIAGQGALGLLMTQVAVLKTPKKLIVIDPLEERRKLALQYGADMALDPFNEDVVEAVKKVTDGYGCDVYIETTGHPSGVKQGMALIRKRGRFVEFSVFSDETTLDWSILGDRKELDVRGAHLGPYCYPVAIDLLDRKKIVPEGIITNRFNIEDFDEALSVANSPASIKVVVVPERL